MTVALLISYLVIYISITNNDYNDNFWEGVRTEAHGMIFDLWIIGVFILFLNEIARKRNENQRYMDEIDDFKSWKSEEAKYRIIGNIKRLNRNNITNINLSRCYLEIVNLKEVNLQDADLKRANLLGTNFQDANLQRVNFQGANLEGTNFQSANLQHVNFQDVGNFATDRTNLKGTNFSMANLAKSDFQQKNLQGVNFQQTNLQGVNFQEVDLRGVKNLTIKQLSKVKTLYLAELDIELMEQVKEKYPHLLENPKIFS